MEYKYNLISLFMSSLRSDSLIFTYYLKRNMYIIINSECRVGLGVINDHHSLVQNKEKDVAMHEIDVLVHV